MLQLTLRVGMSDYVGQVCSVNGVWCMADSQTEIVAVFVPRDHVISRRLQ